MKAKLIVESDGFYNPFDENDLEEAKSKPMSLKDNGNYLGQSKDDFTLSKLKWSKSGSSFKVKANSKFRKGEVVEICPVLLLGDSANSMDKIKDIVFEINAEKGQWGLVLGYGSMYTHSDTPNLEFGYKASTRQMYFISRRAIKENEELTIDYGIDYFKSETDLTGINQQLKDLGLEAIEESGIQPTDADFDSNQRAKEFGRPNSRINPVMSGVAITGIGQQ